MSLWNEWKKECINKWKIRWKKKERRGEERKKEEGKSIGSTIRIQDISDMWTPSHVSTELQWLGPKHLQILTLCFFHSSIFWGLSKELVSISKYIKLMMMIMVVVVTSDTTPFSAPISMRIPWKSYLMYSLLHSLLSPLEFLSSPSFMKSVQSGIFPSHTLRTGYPEISTLLNPTSGQVSTLISLICQ